MWRADKVTYGQTSKKEPSEGEHEPLIVNTVDFSANIAEESVGAETEGEEDHTEKLQQILSVMKELK